MKKINLNKLLKSVLLVLLILFTLIKMIKVGSAEEMPSYAKDPLINWLDSSFPSWSNYESYFNDAFSSCPYYVTFNCGSYKFIDFFVSPGIAFNNYLGYSNNGYFYLDGAQFLPGTSSYVITPDSSVRLNNGLAGYRFCFNSNSSLFAIIEFSVTGSRDVYQNIYFYYSSRSVIFGSTSGTNTQNSIDFNNNICYGPTYVNIGMRSFIFLETTIPIYVENNGLKIQKLPSYNGYTLLVDVKDLLQVNLGLTSYDLSSAVLTLYFEYDNLEHSFVVPSSYFDYVVDEGSVESATDSTISYARYRIPSSFFNFPADTRISLIKVDFSIVHTSVGGSQTEFFKIATDFLIQSIDQFAPDPESISKDSETGVDKLTPAQVDNIRYQVKFNDDGELDFDEFYYVNFPDDFTLYYVYMSNLTLQDLVSAGVSFEGLYEFVQSTVTSIAGAQSIIENQLKNNNYASYFDVVVFEYIKETSGSLTRTYWYYTTASGRIRTTNTILADCFVGINQIAYNSSVLYDYLYSRLNDFEDQTIKLQYEGNVISGNIRDMLYGVSFSLDNIYNAITNLKFPTSSGSSYSLPDLSQELQRILVPSMEWDQINYNEYLNSLGVLALPFEFTFDVQQSMLSNYSSNLYLEINELRVPLGEDELVLFSDQDPFSFSPTSIFPSNLWQIFQYLALFSLVIAEAWFTYCHIFRKEDKE